MISRLRCFVTAFVLFTLSAFAYGEQQETLLPNSALDEPRWGWTSCGYDDDPVHIDSIKILPDPPVAGQNLTVTVKGEAFTTIEDGAYADVLVKVGPIQILKREVDLCYEARHSDVDISCPVEAGQYKVIHTADLPSRIPPAMYTVNIRGYTVDDDDLSCLDLWIDFRLRR